MLAGVDQVQPTLTAPVGQVGLRVSDVGTVSTFLEHSVRVLGVTITAGEELTFTFDLSVGRSTSVHTVAYPPGVFSIDWNAPAGDRIIVHSWRSEPAPDGQFADRLVIDATVVAGQPNRTITITGTPMIGTPGGIEQGSYNDADPFHNLIEPPPWIDLANVTDLKPVDAYTSLLSAQRQQARIVLPMSNRAVSTLPQHVNGSGSRNGQLIPGRLAAYGLGGGDTVQMIPTYVQLDFDLDAGVLPTATVDGIAYDQQPSHVTPTVVPPTTPTDPPDEPPPIGTLPQPVLTAAATAVLIEWATTVAGRAVGAVDVQRASAPVPPVEPVWATIGSGQTDGRHSDRPGFGTWLYRLSQDGLGGPFSEITLAPPATVASPKVITTLTNVDVFGITRRAGRGYAILTNIDTDPGPEQNLAAAVRLLTATGAFDGEPFVVNTYGNTTADKGRYVFGSDPSFGNPAPFPDVGYSPTLRRLWIADGITGVSDSRTGLPPTRTIGGWIAAYTDDGNEIAAAAIPGTQVPYLRVLRIRRMRGVAADDHLIAWADGTGNAFERRPVDGSTVTAFPANSSIRPASADRIQIAKFYWNVAAQGASPDVRIVLAANAVPFPANAWTPHFGVVAQTSGQTVGPYLFPSFALDVPSGASIVGFDIDTSGYDESDNSGQTAVAAIRLSNGQVRLVEWPLSL